MADEPRKGPALRVFAAFMCAVFVVLAALFFPLNGIPQELWRLSPLFGAVIGATYSGVLALTGRGLPWP